jgi:hypothetical protein
MAKSTGGQDPTRDEPGGSRTETKIADVSELGSDAGGDAEADHQRSAKTPPKKRGRGR